MFDKFGKMNSAEELNKAAAGFRDEGDHKSLYELADENGIDKEDVEDYLEGLTEELVSPATAAMGRIKVHEEAKGASPTHKMEMNLICMMLRNMCSEDEGLMAAVMRKDKDPEQIIKGLEEGARKHKSGNMGVSCGTDRQLMNIIKAYYMESTEAFKKRVEGLY